MGVMTASALRASMIGRQQLMEGWQNLALCADKAAEGRVLAAASSIIPAKPNDLHLITAI
jgi:hypothetical protein